MRQKINPPPSSLPRILVVQHAELLVDYRTLFFAIKNVPTRLCPPFFLFFFAEKLEILRVWHSTPVTYTFSKRLTTLNGVIYSMLLGGVENRFVPNVATDIRAGHRVSAVWSLRDGIPDTTL